MTSSPVLYREYISTEIYYLFRPRYIIYFDRHILFISADIYYLFRPTYITYFDRHIFLFRPTYFSISFGIYTLGTPTCEVQTVQHSILMYERLCTDWYVAGVKARDHDHFFLCLPPIVTDIPMTSPPSTPIAWQVRGYHIS